MNLSLQEATTRQLLVKQALKQRPNSVHMPQETAFAATAIAHLRWLNIKLVQFFCHFCTILSIYIRMCIYCVYICIVSAQIPVQTAHCLQIKHLFSCRRICISHSKKNTHTQKRVVPLLLLVCIYDCDCDCCQGTQKIVK